jgi:ribonuclease HI
MARSVKNKYYAYKLADGKQGIAESWAECERLVSGRANARYRGFPSREDAADWLGEGARYEARPKLALRRSKLSPGIYFDAGTGRGDGVEASVTDERGKDLLYLVLPKKQINRFGKQNVSGDTTNNYGELLALSHALRVAKKLRVKKVFGDSQLVIKFWSRGVMKQKELPAKTARLVREVAKARKIFETAGGSVAYVLGSVNPADLGFH